LKYVYQQDIFIAVNFRQFANAAGADEKWLLNSSAIMRRSLQTTPENARWWGLVHVLQDAFGLTLRNAGTAATRALARKSGTGPVIVAEDSASAASLSVDVYRYDTTFLARLSVARVRETPKRRGRRAAASSDPIGKARERGLDLGLLQSSLERSPAERLEILDRNRAFVDELQRRGRRN
jgi:hypothetical protein